ncbi:MAG: phosphatidylglycerol lysyltransferase domain-containing protein [Treponema sp.]|jgi:hypothetical protein|nr:phosphatidylglycerol lysyltransferase domain-containing protein [Treponema sp.]
MKQTEPAKPALAYGLRKHYIRKMELPCYPEFAPIGLEFQSEIQNLLSDAPDGVSEYTFSNLYLFRRRYRYTVSAADGALIVRGEKDGETFFETPCALPPAAVLSVLFQNHGYWKGIPASLLKGAEVFCSQDEFCQRNGVEIVEDRDNFDYLYNRIDLAELSGKKFHKKRNLVNAFLNSYIPQVFPLTDDRVADAMKVLDHWHEDKGEEGDYLASKDALELLGALGMTGSIYYINERPVGWCLGEGLARGAMFAVHFEKGIDDYKGVYQYINQEFTASLPENFIFINREQDLGDEGLRQAKMTYRPVGFVNKYVMRR